MHSSICIVVGKLHGSGANYDDQGPSSLRTACFGYWCTGTCHYFDDFFIRNERCPFLVIW